VMAKMVRLAGAGHIVFGTDAPLQAGIQMRYTADAVQMLDIPAADKEKILCGNAKKILNV